VSEPASQGRAAADPRDLFKVRVRAVVMNLLFLAALIAVLRFGLRITVFPWFIAVLAGAAVLPLAFPARLEDLVSAVVWFALAALAYFYLGEPLFAVLAVVFGFISAGAAANRLMPDGPRRPAGP
jgi:hypothetical protein